MTIDDAHAHCCYVLTNDTSSLIPTTHPYRTVQEIHAPIA
jgi:hypothetical protein